MASELSSNLKLAPILKKAIPFPTFVRIVQNVEFPEIELNFAQQDIENSVEEEFIGFGKVIYLLLPKTKQVLYLGVLLLYVNAPTLVPLFKKPLLSNSIIK